jgi:hypothetical protein
MLSARDRPRTRIVTRRAYRDRCIAACPGRGVGATNHCIHGKDTVIEEVLDWRPYDYFTVRSTVPTPMGPIHFLETVEFEPTPGGTILHFRFGAPKTAKERAIMEQMASWLEESLQASATRLTEQLGEELGRRGRDTTEEPALPQAQPDGPLAGLSPGS